MKSKLFSRFDPKSENNKQFQSDLNILLSLEPQKIGYLVLTTISLKETKNNQERDLLIDKASSNLELELKDINNIIYVIEFLLNQTTDKKLSEDSPEKWTSDLIELEVVKPALNEKLSTFMTQLWNEAKSRYSTIEKENMFKKGILPSFLGIGHTVELRGVFKDTYSFGDDIQRYNPDIIKAIPVISINLILIHGNEQKGIGFQATPEDVRQLLDHLNASLIESKKLEQLFSNI